jgi:hypothetical protein
MDDFCATETAMRFVMVACNLMSLFRQATLQKQPSPALAALRFNCFAAGSWIESNILKMSVPIKRVHLKLYYFCTNRFYAVKQRNYITKTKGGKTASAGKI